jgi:hypothetical protein
MMEIDQVAALRTTPDFHLLLTQNNPPARISLPPLWIAPLAKWLFDSILDERLR